MTTRVSSKRLTNTGVLLVNRSVGKDQRYRLSRATRVSNRRPGAGPENLGRLGGRRQQVVDVRNDQPVSCQRTRRVPDVPDVSKPARGIHPVNAPVLAPRVNLDVARE